MTRFESLDLTPEWRDEGSEIVDREYMERLNRNAPLLLKIQAGLARKLAEEKDQEFNDKYFMWWVGTFGDDFRSQCVNDPKHAFFIKKYEEAMADKSEKDMEENLKKIEEILHSPAGLA